MKTYHVVLDISVIGDDDFGVVYLVDAENEAGAKSTAFEWVREDTYLQYGHIDNLVINELVSMKEIEAQS